jgi:hypothetical protein
VCQSEAKIMLRLKNFLLESNTLLIRGSIVILVFMLFIQLGKKKNKIFNKFSFIIFYIFQHHPTPTACSRAYTRQRKHRKRNQSFTASRAT